MGADTYLRLASVYIYSGQILPTRPYAPLRFGTTKILFIA